MVVKYFVDGPSKHFTDIREEMMVWVDQVMAKLLRNSEPGDELWICRSRYLGPMAGHLGLGIVRNGNVVLYERIKNY